MTPADIAHELRQVADSYSRDAQVAELRSDERLIYRTIAGELRKVADETESTANESETP